MAEKLRVGIVGCGGMANSHVSRFSAIFDHVSITAVCDSELARAQAVAALLPQPVLVSADWRELYDAVDAVLLVLPHHLHCAATVDFLQAGKHVLVEKPMANSEEECQRMIAAAQQADRVLMVAYCMRFHPMVVKLKELLDAKVYGDCFQLSIWTEQHTQYPPEHWASSAKTLGGGQLFSHGCHYIDLLLWMLGEPVSGTHFGTHFGTPWMEREGTSNVTIQFASGALGYHMGTWGARGSRLRYAIHAHCTNAMLEAALSDGKLYVHTKASLHVPGVPENQTQAVILETPNAKATEQEMAHFVDCIHSGRRSLTDPAGSLQGLRVIWKLYEAEEQHRLADLRGLGLPKA